MGNELEAFRRDEEFTLDSLQADWFPLPIGLFLSVEARRILGLRGGFELAKAYFGAKGELDKYNFWSRGGWKFHLSNFFEVGY